MLTTESLDLLFNDARTHNHWQNVDVPDYMLSEAYNLAKMAPTSANCNPLRIIFVKSPEAKAKLKPCLMEANVEKTMTAPVTAIFANDMAFHEKLPQLFPHADAKSWFAGNAPLIEETACRNGSLQAGYFMLAARAVGLDCGPMSGFDAAMVDAEFFKGTTFTSNFLCNLGFGDLTKVFPRSPRFEFNDVCKII